MGGTRMSNAAKANEMTEERTSATRVVESVRAVQERKYGKFANKLATTAPG
jgi:hypothetical protein